MWENVIGKLVLRGTQIVVLTGLRKRVLRLAREGHPGIVSMKRRLRTKIWWPGCEKEAEKFCKACPPCQMVGMPTSPETLKITELRSWPWQHISAVPAIRRPSVRSCWLLQSIYGSRSFEVYNNWHDHWKPQEDVAYSWTIVLLL